MSTPKKVIAINSSMRKKNTYKVLEDICTNLTKCDIDCEIISLSDYEIKECTGCERCIKDDICPINDDMKELMEKLIASDGVILSTPVYMGNVSGRLKTFLDRTCRWFHRPALVAKPVLLVSTTAGSGLKFTLDYMEKTAISWGMHPCAKIGKKVNTTIDPNAYRDFLINIKKDKSLYKPSLSQLLSFQLQRILAQKILPIDAKYWQDKGWFLKDYYFDCRINPLNRGLSTLFYKFLSSRIKRVEE